MDIFVILCNYENCQFQLFKEVRRLNSFNFTGTSMNVKYALQEFWCYSLAINLVIENRTLEWLLWYTMIFPLFGAFLKRTPLAGLFPSLYLLLITLRVFGLRMRQKDWIAAGWWVGKNSCSRATTQRDAVSGDILEWRKERKGEMVCGWRRKRDGPNEWDKRDPNALKVGAFQEAVTHLLPRRAEWVFQPLSNFYGRISGAGRGETQMEARNGELMSLAQRMWTFSRRTKVH